MANKFYNKDVKEVIKELDTVINSGLDNTEAEERLKNNGPNKLDSAKKKSILLTILAQFKDFLVVILLIAATISIIVGDDMLDGIIIIAIVIVNMVIGITQESKANDALKELKNMASPKAKVKRDKVVEKIDSDKLVVGDIVVLDAGDYVPADIRIIESINLKIDESALTGESLPVDKKSEAIVDPEASLGDRVNLAYMGTVVNYGRGIGVVYATGMNTEMGGIATILNEVDEVDTPLQKKLNNLAKNLGIICILACIAVFSIGLYHGMDILEIFMVAVSLAVAAVPEGISIIITIILAIGVQKMVKANVIVKKLRAVETLGSTTVICSDKTGTLTQNKMTVVKVFDTENIYKVTGLGYERVGDIVSTNQKPLTKNITKLVEGGVLCNDSLYNIYDQQIIGDPTEGAMLVLGEKLKLNKDTLNYKYKRIQEIPFDSDRKLMSTYHLNGDSVIMYTKGAPDEIIRRSTKVYKDGQVIEMTEAMKNKLIEQNENFAKEAYRVLGVAYKDYVNVNEIDNKEEDLIYVGLMCMIDPPREEVADAIVKCKHAGITVKMITGDHKITASAIAKTLGIMGDNEEALEGREINKLSDEELKEKVKTVNVFARVSPEHKVRIVTAIKENNNIVAMTGDGVNDAPALKRADIGIAMGITGTDVSKEAADMILTDDNFVSIVDAVEEGRTIYNNIRKVIGYLLSANIGEILIIFIAIAANLPVPLVATQLLFVNLLTDAFPAFALGMEEKEPGIMDIKPRDPNEPIINSYMKKAIAFKSIFLCIGVLGAYLFGLHFYNYQIAMTICFVTLVSSELLISYAARTNQYIGPKKELFTNLFLNRSIFFSFSILIVLIYVPLFNDLFTTVPLNLKQVGVCLLFSLVPVVASEVSKVMFIKK